MKTFKTIAITLLCTAVVWASPSSSVELEELQDYQVTVLQSLDQPSQGSFKTAEEKLMEVEAMVKLYSQMKDAYLATPGRGQRNALAASQRQANSQSHLNVLQQHQEQYLRACELKTRTVSNI